MKKENIPNILTIIRFILIPFIFTSVVNEDFLATIVIFTISAITDMLDGYIARKYNLITDFGKMIDAIADKILVNPILIILAASGFISPIIPVIIIARDSVVNSIKMIAWSKGQVVAAIKMGKLKTDSLMVGITLTLFYNLPFELISLRISDFLLALAAILSVISGVKYYMMAKPYLKDR